MPLLYNETSIVPAPLINVSPQFVTDANGAITSLIYQITLTGTLLSVGPDDSPQPTAAQLGIILAKQANLISLFADSGKVLEVYSPDGTQVTKCRAVVKSVDFPEDIWVQTSKYTIVLESTTFYDKPNLDNLPNVEDPTNTYQVEEAGITVSTSDGSILPIWKITHNVSAKGRVTYNDDGSIIPAWQNAQTWVLAQLREDNIVSTPFDSLNLQANSGYNHKRTGSQDELAGNYSVAEEWIYAYNVKATEDYQISVRYTPEDASTTTTVTVAGTVKGLSAIVNIVSDRMPNAISYFNTVSPTFFSRAQAVVGMGILNALGSNGSNDYNYADGTISYSYEYNDRYAPNDDVYETYTINRKLAADDAQAVVTVSGTIQGRLHVGERNLNFLRYTRAQSYFNSLLSSNTFYARAQTAGISDLKPNSLNTSLDTNMFEGSIGYSYEFDNRPFVLAKNEYTIELRYSKDDGITTVSISGTIQGLRVNDSDPYTVKYQNALAFYATWIPQIPQLISDFLSREGDDINLNPTPSGISRSDNDYNGVITYSREYNTSIPPTIAGALTESITISDTNATPVIAIIPIPGRSAGPIMQNINTIKEKTRSLTIEANMVFGSDEPNTDDLVATYKPTGSVVYVDRDETSWSPFNFRYTRTVSWVYNS